MKTYFKLMIWHERDDSLMRDSYKRIFEKDMLRKTPRSCKWFNRNMIGTAQMSDEREARLKELMNGRLTITDREPFWWRDK